MKNNRKILSHLILLIFSSCNELVEEEINGLNKNPVPKYQTYHLLTNQEVEEELFVDTVQEGDIIELEVSGIEYVPKFSEVYTRTVKSTWVEKECIDRDPICMRCDKGLRCFENHREGGCQLKYKDYNGITEKPIIFTNDLANLSIKFKLGEKVKSFGVIIEKEGKIAKAKIIITRELILNGNEFSLIVLQDQDSTKVKIGFQGYGHCDGRGKERFSVGGNRSSSSVGNKSNKKFIVNLNLQRKH